MRGSAAQAAQHAAGDVEALADIRIDHLRKDSLGHDGLTSAHVQQIWRINSVQGAKSFSAAFGDVCRHERDALHACGRGCSSAMAASWRPWSPPTSRSMERGSSMYFDSRSRDLRFPQLEPGDLVEIEYRLLPAAAVNPWAGYYARLDLFRDSLCRPGCGGGC